LFHNLKEGRSPSASSGKLTGKREHMHRTAQRQPSKGERSMAQESMRELDEINQHVAEHLYSLGVRDCALSERLVRECVGEARRCPGVSEKSQLLRRSIEEAERRVDQALAGLCGDERSKGVSIERLRAALHLDEGTTLSVDEIIQAVRLRPDVFERLASIIRRATPPEAPLTMEKHSFSRGNTASGERECQGDVALPLKSGSCGTTLSRRWVVFSLVSGTTVLAVLTVARAMLAIGLSDTGLALLVIYTLLFSTLALSFWTAMIGLLVNLAGGDTRSIGRSTPRANGMPELSVSPTRTALLMPIHNEDPIRAFAGLRATFDSLRETGRGDEFEVFILSDTQDSDIYVQEEMHWHRMCCDFKAYGRIFYRRRKDNCGRKSGNVEEFCQRWGGRYRFMVVLDADSIMSGACITTLLDMIEAHPQVALIQSSPVAIGQETLFARILQFGSSVLSPLYSAGSAWWFRGESNYWGHNAIVRVKPFAQHCGLPMLPGREPLGGNILSHDFVEAALLRNAGWEVWLVNEVEGSYEQVPPTLLDYVKREQRWCQGNLQHIRVLLAQKFASLSRVHLLMGIMNYVASPLWLLFLLLGTMELSWQAQLTATQEEFQRASADLRSMFWITMAMLFLPRVGGQLNSYLDHRQMKSRGGYLRFTLSLCLEVLVATAIAPVLMLYQCRFVCATLLGRSVAWSGQARDGHVVSLREATAAHGILTLLGIGGAIAVHAYLPQFFWWTSPVLLGLMISIVTSSVTSSEVLGKGARSLRLFLIPEEAHSPRVILQLQEHLALLGAKGDAMRPSVDGEFGDHKRTLRLVPGFTNAANK